MIFFILLFMSLLLIKGFMKNAKDIVPSLAAFFNLFLGDKFKVLKEFSKYISEHDPSLQICSFEFKSFIIFALVIVQFLHK